MAKTSAQRIALLVSSRQVGSFEPCMRPFRCRDFAPICARGLDFVGFLTIWGIEKPVTYVFSIAG